MLDKSIYIRRRQRLLDKMKGESGLIIFIGNVEAPAQYKDNQYKFRQDSTWMYFFGIDAPDFSATLDLDSGVQTIYADDIDIDDIIWMGPQPSVASIAQTTGVNTSAPKAALENVLIEARRSGRKIHFVPASRYATMLRLSSLLGLDPQETTSSGKGGCAKASLPLVRAIISMRLVKEDCEIELLDNAGDLGFKMHSIARKGIVPGVIEQQIVGNMESATLADGWGTSFPIIFTQHGEIFHNHAHNCIIEPGKLLVVDAGAENNEHYASDYTRTYPTGGHFSSMQKDIYQIVYDCNELAFSLVKPGITYRDVHISVASLMLERLADLGLVRGDVNEMVANGIAGLFMPHGLGHNMGLDCHDMEDYGEDLVGYDDDQTRSAQLGLGSLRMARRLVPGNVITDEPGIYFIPALIEQWKKDGTDKGYVNYPKLKDYYDFGGIRLEDDLLVTVDGVRRLGSERLPIAPDEVEEAMAKDRY